MDARDAAKPVRKPGPKPSLSSHPKVQYLILYNFQSAIAWLVVLGRVCLLLPLRGLDRVYPGVGKFAKWTQTVALLEVFHAMIGLVRTSLLTTVMQVGSRLLLIWGVINNFPFLARSAAYPSMLFAWSVTEVIRYAYFVLTLSGYYFRPMTWLRYSTFFVLYPLGIVSECWLLYGAIEPARKVRPEYAWALQLALFLYIPGSYILYTHMMRQRRKVMKSMQGKDMGKKTT